jgi:DNA-binding NarL/FixJ family response regulator
VTRILIADDHPIVRSGIRAVLAAQPTWQVVAEAADGEDAVAKALQTAPDVAIVDYALPRLNGIEVTRQIREKLSRTEVLIFTMHDNDALVGELLKAGGRGFLLKSEGGSNLIAAVRSLASHAPFFTGRVSEALIRSFTWRPRGETSALSARERQVIQLIAEGCTSKEVARLLNISHKTVDTHRAAIMRKLQLGSPVALVRYAVRNKLVVA